MPRAAPSFVLLIPLYCFPGSADPICIAWFPNKMACSAEYLERFCLSCGVSQRYRDGKVLDNGSAIREEVPGPTVCTEEREKVAFRTENAVACRTTGNLQSLYYSVNNLRSVRSRRGGLAAKVREDLFSAVVYLRLL